MALDRVWVFDPAPRLPLGGYAYPGGRVACLGGFGCCRARVDTLTGCRGVYGARVASIVSEMGRNGAFRYGYANAPNRVAGLGAGYGLRVPYWLLWVLRVSGVPCPCAVWLCFGLHVLPCVSVSV